MSAMNHNRMKLVALLSTLDICPEETQTLIGLAQEITKNRFIEFHHLVSTKMQEEISLLMEDDDFDHRTILETTLGNSAVIRWLEGDSELLADLIFKYPDTCASDVAIDTIAECFEIAAMEAQSHGSRWPTTTDKTKQ